MKRKKLSLIPLLTLCVASASAANSETNKLPAANAPAAAKPTEHVAPAKPTKKTIAAFTGKVTKNKVRLRQQPNLEGHIVQELNNGDLLIVVGEEDDFYAVEPPEGTKAYVFRTYILDGKVEGQNVNIRLEPKLEAPVLAQLHSGETVIGRISPLDSKWLEISVPKTTTFYVSKDYVEKIGDPAFMSTMKKRRDEVNRLLNDAYLSSQSEIHKPFDSINFNATTAKFDRVIKDYPEFNEQVARANELLTKFKDEYTKKKIAHLEGISKERIDIEKLAKEKDKLSLAYQEQQMRLTQLEKRLKTEQQNGSGSPGTMAQWIPLEEKHYHDWMEKNGERSIDEFYQEQTEKGIMLQGTLEAYQRNIKNKPGDYVLLNSHNMPIAFLYSTQVNLQDLVGQELTLKAAPRPNNNFAFPAYFVLKVQ